MHPVIATLFIFLSLTVILGFTIYSISFHGRKKNIKEVFSSSHIFAIGIGVAAFLAFIPLYYTSYDYGDSITVVRPLLLSFYNAMRLFILEGDYAAVRDMTVGLPEFLHAVYTLLITALFIVAPILTFTTVLSLFKNFRGMVRFALSNKKRIFVMSELNEKALVLANSIKEKYKKENEGSDDCLIVFTDVFPKNEEREYELASEAEKLDAICLKIDVTQLDFYSKKAPVEIFLIGSDESENVEQAIRITGELNRLNKKDNVKLFVFTAKESNAYILDSVRYDNLIKRAIAKQFGDDAFKLRRVDEVRQLVWNTVSDMRVFDIAQKNDNTLSVLILGMGMYGMEFFKALIWYCQFEGYKLKINVVDNRTDGYDGRKGIRSSIEHRFPDLLRHNGGKDSNDAYYDIEIIEGIDMSSSTFDELAEYSGDDDKKAALCKRIKETNLAIVSLGDDDINIETSIRMRSLFDRIHGFKATSTTDISDEKVQIYSVVYNERKSGLLRSDSLGSDNRFLINYSDIPYNIHFIGSMAKQFDYDSICGADIENNAKMHHHGWVDIEADICRKGSAVDGDEIITAQRIENEVRFERFEYYRLSSIAKEMHRKAIVGNDILRAQTVCRDKGGPMCQCENCLRGKKSEHKRWNAYTRLQGYVYLGEEKRARAMQHNSLTGWESLNPDSKIKA